MHPGDELLVPTGLPYPAAGWTSAVETFTVLLSDSRKMGRWQVTWRVDERGDGLVLVDEHQII